MDDPWTIPVVRVELTLADGTLLARDWTMVEQEDLTRLRSRMDGPPEWLTDQRRVWDHPQDPVTFKARVREGHEAEARVLLGID